MRRTLISISVVFLLIGSAQPLALGKKNKKDNNALLKTIKTLYVDGSLIAVSYTRKHLAQDTCLTSTLQLSEADAILEIWEETPSPCGGERTMSGVCSKIVVKLLDPKTKELVWYREDDHLPAVDLVHQANGAYDWVLWNLKNSCCKGRP